MLELRWAESSPGRRLDDKGSGNGVSGLPSPQLASDHWQSSWACQLTVVCLPCSEELCWQCLELMDCLNLARWYQIVFFLAARGFCFPLRYLWLSGESIIFPLLLKNLRGTYRKKKDDQMIRFSSLRLNWEVAWRRLVMEGPGMGKRPSKQLYPLCMWPSSLSPSLPAPPSSLAFAQPRGSAFCLGCWWA